MDKLKITQKEFDELYVIDSEDIPIDDKLVDEKSKEETVLTESEKVIDDLSYATDVEEEIENENE